MSSRRPVAISLTKESGRKRKHEDHSSESDTGSSKSARSDRKMPRDQKKSSDSGRRGWTGPPEKDPTLHKRICAYLTENKDKQYIDIEEMSKKLHRNHEEYGRKKLKAFRAICEAAFEHIDMENDMEEAEKEKKAKEEKAKKQAEAEKAKKEQAAKKEAEKKQSETSEKKAADKSKDPETAKVPSTNKMMSNLYGGKATEEAAKPVNGHSAEKSAESKPSDEKRVTDVAKAVTDTPSASRGASPAPSVGSKKAVPAPPAAARRPKKNQIDVVESNVTFKDVGGMSSTLVQVCKLLIHLKHPEVYQRIGVVPPRGFLLHGPPGCGKTLLANAIAGQLKLPLIKLAATEIVSGVSGESESKLRDLFEQAMQTAPCVLFIDEIDAITQRRENAQKGMESRIVGQLLACMDNLNSKGNEKEGQVVVIGATNRPDSLDPALRRAGRFEREIAMGIPDAEARLEILRVLTAGLNLEAGFDLKLLARNCPGYVGADLNSLCRESAIVAVNRIFKVLSPASSSSSSSSAPPTSSNKAEELGELLAWLDNTDPLSDESLSKVCIQMADFDKALKVVQPSAKREGFATVPDVTWDDIGALGDLREELELSILGPVNHPEVTKALGMQAPTGILLCGPPGCGKTLLAKAVANQAGINFISVKGPELLNMYVGESERAVRQVFQRARNSSPCVIFFDELDALCPRRSGGKDGGSSNDSSARVVNQLLTEMDGMESRRGVFVMGATNRVDIIDPAVLRPGRLQKILFVDLPSEAGREDILRALTKNGTRPRMSIDVDLTHIARHPSAAAFSGADMGALVTEASVLAFKEHLEAIASGDSEGSDVRVYHKHFTGAFDKVRPSVSKTDRKLYERMKRTYAVTGMNDNDESEESGTSGAKRRKVAEDQSASLEKEMADHDVDESHDDTEEGIRQRLFISKHADSFKSMKKVIDYIHPVKKRVEIMTRILDNSATPTQLHSSQARASDDEFIRRHESILPRDIAQLLTKSQRRDTCKSVLMHRPDVPTPALFRVADDMPYVMAFDILPADIAKCLFAEERRQLVACMLWKRAGWMAGPLQLGGEHSVTQDTIDELTKPDPYGFKADKAFVHAEQDILPTDVAEFMHWWVRRRVVNILTGGARPVKRRPAPVHDDLADDMEVEEGAGAQPPSPPPTLAREAEATQFILQHPDILPTDLAELMTVNQKSNILGCILRARDGFSVHVISDKYPTIDDWMVNEIRFGHDPFEAKRDEEYITKHVHLIPREVAVLMRPGQRRALVDKLQSKRSSNSVFALLGSDSAATAATDSTTASEDPNGTQTVSESVTEPETIEQVEPPAELSKEKSQEAPQSKTPQQHLETETSQTSEAPQTEDSTDKSRPGSAEQDKSQSDKGEASSSDKPQSPPAAQINADEEESSSNKGAAAEGAVAAAAPAPAPVKKASIKISLQKGMEEPKPKKLGLKVAEWVPHGESAFRNCENVAETSAVEPRKNSRFLVGMEVRVSDSAPDKLQAGQEGVIIQIAATMGAAVVSLNSNKKNISVKFNLLEPFIPDVDEACKLLVTGETEKLARMKDYVENDEDNVVVQFGDGSCREVALEQLCKVRV